MRKFIAAVEIVFGAFLLLYMIIGGLFLQGALSDPSQHVTVPKIVFFYVALIPMSVLYITAGIWLYSNKKYAVVMSIVAVAVQVFVWLVSDYFLK